MYHKKIGLTGGGGDGGIISRSKRAPWEENWVSSGVDNVVWGVRGCPPWSPLVEMYLPGTDEIGFDPKMIWLLILGWLSPLLPTLEAAKEYRVSLGVDNVVWGVRGCPPWSPLVEMYLPGIDEIGFDQ